MRKPRYSRRARSWSCGLAAAAGLFALATPTLAAGHGHRPGNAKHKQTPELSAKRAYWRVSVSGQSKVVPAGGSVQYCVTAPPESITPVVALTARKKGEHIYGVKVVGPTAAGETPFVEHGFEGHSTLVQEETRPVDFLRLTKHFTSTGAAFPAGTYNLRLVIVLGHDARSESKLVTSESVKLVPRQGC